MSSLALLQSVGLREQRATVLIAPLDYKQIYPLTHVYTAALSLKRAQAKMHAFLRSVGQDKVIGKLEPLEVFLLTQPSGSFGSIGALLHLCRDAHFDIRPDERNLALYLVGAASIDAAKAMAAVVSAEHVQIHNQIGTTDCGPVPIYLQNATALKQKSLK